MGLHTSSFSDPVRDKVLLTLAYAHSSLLSPLSFDLIREISSYFGFQSSLVPALCGNTLRLFDVKGKTMRESMLNVRITVGAVYSFLDNEEILVVGGQPEAASAWLISAITSKARVLEDMGTRRAWPGICAFRESGYVFGGGFPSVCSAEKWDWRAGKWTSLRDMTYPRFAFTPCRHGYVIYLVDFSQSHKKVEVFGVNSEAFSTLPMRLPGFYCVSSLCFIVDGGLVVLCEASPSESVRWRLGREGKTEVAKIRSQGIRPYSPCPLLRYKDAVYYSSFDDRQLISFDLRTETFQKEIWSNETISTIK